MSEQIRAFVAISLPESILATAVKAQKALEAFRLQVRWTRPEGIHLTLKFLGDILTGDVERVRGAMEEAAREYAPMSLKAQGMGVFPGLNRPRVIWVGMTGQVEALAELQQDLDMRLESLGFPGETRPFRAHLTLGRVKGRLDPKQFADALAGLGRVETEPFVARSIDLFQSELRPSGAVYTKLVEAPLGTDSKD